MTVKFKYNIAQPDISNKEIDYVMEALAENELSGHGRHVKLFEERFAKFIGSEFALMCPNGTITLHLILESLGIGPGDEVILPSNTISNCIYVVSLTGATPVVVDIDPNSWCMDPKEFKNAVTDKTKAVMPVHLFGGIPCNMTEINKIAKKNKITVIEDCAESIGSKYDGKMTGNIGDVASFSLFANKTIMTGEGGIITTSNKKLYERMKYLRNVAYGTDPETKFWANDMGFNYRPSNLCAALGLGQLDRIDYLMKRRNDIHDWYMKYLSNKFIWQKPYPTSEPCCWMNAILVPENVNRSYMMKYLIKNGIETRPTFPPLGQHPYLKKEKYTVRSMGEKVSEDVWNRGLLLPSAGKGIDEDAVKDICKFANAYIGE